MAALSDSVPELHIKKQPPIWTYKGTTSILIFSSKPLLLEMEMINLEER